MKKILILVILAVGVWYLTGQLKHAVAPAGPGGVAVSPAGYADPIGKGMTPWRVDQGVDYNGPGPLYAMGSGTILTLYDSGWPGGTFIKLHLDSGRYKGRYVYYAEQVDPKVSLGQHVHSGQLIAECRPVKYCLEIGWGHASGDNTMAYSLGQSQAGIAAGDPGHYQTACGVQFSALLVSLGAPAGIMQSPPTQGSSC